MDVDGSYKQFGHVKIVEVCHAHPLARCSPIGFNYGTYCACFFPEVTSFVSFAFRSSQMHTQFTVAPSLCPHVFNI